MINRLEIKSVASFDEQGVIIDGLEKINFIYGSNGTGKTTISRLLYDPNHEDFKSSDVVWKMGQPIKTLVYDKEFRERNFGKENIDGVFTLGEATKEEKEKIAEKESELKDLRTEIGTKRANKISLEDKIEEEIEQFKETSWNFFYKQNEKNFKEAFRGVLNKKSFYERILHENAQNSSALKEEEDLINRAQTIFDESPEQISPIAQIEYQRIIEIEAESLWENKIVGKSDVEIGKLIQHLNINDWVNEGRDYLQDDETCPFCQQDTITEYFRAQLEDYFDESYSKALEEIKSLSTEYDRLTSNLLSQLDIIETNQKDFRDTKLDVDLFSTHLKTLRSQVNNNIGKIANKKKEPSRSIELVPLDEQLSNLQKIINNANKLIEENNKLVRNFETERSTLVNEIWRYVIETGKAEIDRHVKKVSGLRSSLKTAVDKLKEAKKKENELKSEIAELSKNVTSVQPTVDEINRTLNSFGFSNFSIVPSELDKDKYQIQRENGDLAESTLSEGEITFITFLYFLQRIKGGLTKDSISEERIIVIDDPISSLDSNILFVVSTLIKEIIKEIRQDKGNIQQVIILTHNVYFHKEVSFIDGRTERIGDTNYWILRRNGNTASIQSYGMENPISTSYELLWKELREKDKNSGIAIQNIMRRIIENYFKILGKYGDDQLIQKFENAEDQKVCRSLISWINDGSHAVSDDLYVEVPHDTIDRYFEVFRRIFEETDHIGHYNMMMRIEEEETQNT